MGEAGDGCSDCACPREDHYPEHVGGSGGCSCGGCEGFQ